MIHFVITGDALSAGTEMMDADVFPNYNLLLEQFRGKELNERRIYRWRLQAQWGLKHFKTGRYEDVFKGRSRSSLCCETRQKS
jgi:hypothetical protein